MISLTLAQLDQLDQNGWVSFQIPDLWLALLGQARALKQTDQFHSAEIKAKISSDQQSLIRNDLIHWVKRDSGQPAEQAFNSMIQFMMYQIKDYFRIGLQDFEAHYAIYPTNHFYQRHSDQKKEKNQRHFSFVYYLNPDWKPENGGELVGYIGDTSEKKMSALPYGGTFILFKSEIEHEVCQSYAERFSVTGWMRTV